MKLVKYLETNEDWIPSYRLSTMSGFRVGDSEFLRKERFNMDEHNKTPLLYCFFAELFPEGYRVGVWGADDFGMEKDFSPKHKIPALKCYHQLDMYRPLTERVLKDLGFVIA